MLRLLAIQWPANGERRTVAFAVCSSELQARGYADELRATWRGKLPGLRVRTSSRWIRAHGCTSEVWVTTATCNAEPSGVKP